MKITGKWRCLIVSSCLLYSFSACRTTEAPTVARAKADSGGVIGDFVGADVIQERMTKKLIDANDPASIGFDISRILGNSVYLQRSLLGAGEVVGGVSQFRGGAPNPMGVLLWYQTMSTFSKSLGELCGQDVDARSLKFKNLPSIKPVVQKDFNVVLRKVCLGQDSELDLNQLWLRTVALDATVEREAFIKEFTVNRPAASLVGNARVEAVMMGVFMTPSFLLQTH